MALLIPDDLQRLARVVISPEVLVKILAEGEHRYRVKGLPEGAKALRFGIDDMGRVVLIIEHPTFCALPEGAIPKFLDVSFERIDDAPAPDVITGN